MDYLSFLLPAIDAFHSIGYWIAFFAAFLETAVGVGLLLPGTSIIILLGAFAAHGYLDIGDLLWFAIIGAILGDNLNYFLGKKYGANWVKNGIWFIKPKHLERGKTFLNSHGAKSIFFARFIPSLKEVVPLIAGTLKMDKKLFFIWNVLGGIGWGLLFILSGYIFSQSLNIAQTWLSRAGFFLLILILFLVLFYLLKFFIIRRGKQVMLLIKSLWGSIKTSVSENEDIKKISENNPRITAFLNKRFNRTKFSGTPLTVLTLAFLYIFSLFAGIVEDIITSDIIVSIDVRVANLLAIFRTELFDKIFLSITLLGKSEVVFIFVAASMLLLWIFNKRLYIFPLFVSLLGSTLFTYFGKIAFHRARPEVALYTEHSFSFPSGHATIAVAFYGFLIYIFTRNVTSFKKKINILFLGFIIIFSIGFSRLYLGVHYLSDVWAGYLIGALWLIIGITISEWLQYKIKNKKISIKKRSKKTVAFTIVFLALSFYAWSAFFYNPVLDEKKINKIEIINENQIIDIFSNDQLRYTETISGNKQEPISLVILAKSDIELISIIEKSGWYLADNVGVGSVLKVYKAAISNSQYKTAPMTPSFWNNKVHNFGFEKPTKENNIRKRHHARFWKTGYQTKDGYNIYVGTVSLDSDIKWFVTHKIDPNIDAEQNLLYGDLNKSEHVLKFKLEQLVKPSIGQNFSGDSFFTYGKLYIITLK
jgi:undecaprenyl-diphosphatase